MISKKEKSFNRYERGMTVTKGEIKRNQVSYVVVR